LATVSDKLMKEYDGFGPCISLYMYILLPWQVSPVPIVKSPELELLLILTGSLNPFSSEKVLVCVVCPQKTGGRVPSLITGGLASFGVNSMSKTGGRRNLFIARASGTSCC
jgi:hypothetical protein